MDENSGSDWSIAQGRLSRRRAIAAVGTVVGGGAVLAAGSGDARASVSVESFDVADATFEAAEVTPVIDAEIGYAYRAASVAELWLGLLVGETVVAEQSLRTGSEELENTAELSGRVTDADGYSAADFTVESGSETTVTVNAGVRFEVRDADGAVVASDEARDESDVRLVSPEGETHATIGGSAEIVDEE
jgi:hypothetical protein